MSSTPSARAAPIPASHRGARPSPSGASDSSPVARAVPALALNSSALDTKPAKATPRSRKATETPGRPTKATSVSSDPAKSKNVKRLALDQAAAGASTFTPTGRANGGGPKASPRSAPSPRRPKSAESSGASADSRRRSAPLRPTSATLTPAEALKLARKLSAAEKGPEAAGRKSPAAHRNVVPRPCARPCDRSACRSSPVGCSCCAAVAASSSSSSSSPMSPALRYAMGADGSPSGSTACAGAAALRGLPLDAALASGAAAAASVSASYCNGGALGHFDRGGHFDRTSHASGCAMPRCMSVPAPLAASLGPGRAMAAGAGSSAAGAGRRHPSPESDCGGRNNSAELKGEHVKDRPERMTSRGSAAASIALASKRLMLQQQQQLVAAGEAPADAAAKARWQVGAMLAVPEVRDACIATMGTECPSPRSHGGGSSSGGGGGLSVSVGGFGGSGVGPGAPSPLRGLRGSAWAAARTAVRRASSTAYAINQFKAAPAAQTRAGQELDHAEHVKDKPEREGRRSSRSGASTARGALESSSSLAGLDTRAAATKKALERAAASGLCAAVELYARGADTRADERFGVSISLVPNDGQGGAAQRLGAELSASSSAAAAAAAAAAASSDLRPVRVSIRERPDGRIGVSVAEHRRCAFVLSAPGNAPTPRKKRASPKSAAAKAAAATSTLRVQLYATVARGGRNLAPLEILRHPLLAAPVEVELGSAADDGAPLAQLETDGVATHVYAQVTRNGAVVGAGLVGLDATEPAAYDIGGARLERRALLPEGGSGDASTPAAAAAAAAPRHVPSGAAKVVRRKSIDDKLLGRDAGDGVSWPGKAAAASGERVDGPVRVAIGPNAGSAGGDFSVNFNYSPGGGGGGGGGGNAGEPKLDVRIVNSGEQRRVLVMRSDAQK